MWSNKRSFLRLRCTDYQRLWFKPVSAQAYSIVVVQLVIGIVLSSLRLDTCGPDQSGSNFEPIKGRTKKDEQQANKKSDQQPNSHVSTRASRVRSGTSCPSAPIKVTDHFLRYLIRYLLEWSLTGCGVSCLDDRKSCGFFFRQRRSS
jgi:hypothetical protein